MFVGKTGIIDNNSNDENQAARIFETKVEADSKNKTTLGGDIVKLVARAYLVKSKKNKDLIADIDAGIKKEVSVSCSVANVRCSICGNNRRTESCNHIIGKTYGDNLCYNILENPTDTYEWSFVAKPIANSKPHDKNNKEEVGINNTKINGENIIESLKIIQKVCEDNSKDCTKCPFETQGACGITNLTPDNWKVLEYAKFQALG